MEANKELKVELIDWEASVVMSRRTTTSISNIGSIIAEVFEDIFKMNLQPTGPVMVVHYDKEFNADNAEFEVCVPINKTIIVENYDNIRKFEGGLHVCVTFIGPYSRIAEAYAKAVKWIVDNGYQVIRAPFEVYLFGPEGSKNQTEYITEVCFPVSK